MASEVGIRFHGLRIPPGVRMATRIPYLRMVVYEVWRMQLPDRVLSRIMILFGYLPACYRLSALEQLTVPFTM